MSSLSAAHSGYNHQDCLTAYSLAMLLLPSGYVKVTVDLKSTGLDCFDDLEIVSEKRIRIQIKSDVTESRALKETDFKTTAIDFRIDRLLHSFLNDQDPPDGYRLITTYSSPDESLCKYIEEQEAGSALSPFLSTKCYKLKPDIIWPENSPPVWKDLKNFSRQDFLSFSDRFLIETDCPKSSGELRNPGPLDELLIWILKEKVGIGYWPNHNRDVVDSVASLIRTASYARTHSLAFDQKAIIDALKIQVDYGKVEETFPAQSDLRVSQEEALNQLKSKLDTNPRIAVTGPPGIGKSWLLAELKEKLNQEGWTTAIHYCFIDPYDDEKTSRASVNSMIGSLIYQLGEAYPLVVAAMEPRFSPHPEGLEGILQKISHQDQSKVAIIVDGLDHVERLEKNTISNSAVEIVNELVYLHLPKNVVILLGSQPGSHLSEFLDIGYEYNVQEWDARTMGQLIEKMGLVNALSELAVLEKNEEVIEAIITKSSGNPLYASYLIRTLLSSKSEEQFKTSLNVCEVITNMPDLELGINSYYDWLISDFSAESGAYWICELLSLLNFPVSISELGEIRPEFSHYIESTIKRLAPVLYSDITRGGIRLYHESFQRYIRERLNNNPAVNFSAILNPIIGWLIGKGFYHDSRSFRHLFQLLIKANQSNKVTELIPDSFVIDSIASGNPEDAVQNNITLGAEIAAQKQDWAELTRLVELSRAANNFYRWRLDEPDIAENYGKSYSALFGATSLAERLTSNGRCTFPSRPGLLLCKACDNAGAVAPWKEYIKAHSDTIRNDNTNYDDVYENRVGFAQLTGSFRIFGRDFSIEKAYKILTSENNQVHFEGVARTLLEVHGYDALLELTQSLPCCIGRAFCHLVLALDSESPIQSTEHIQQAVEDGIPPEKWAVCISLGAEPTSFDNTFLDLHLLTETVLGEKVEFDHNAVEEWISIVALTGAIGDSIAIERVKKGIKNDSWFHKWLRFCIALYGTNKDENELVAALRELSTDIEVFAGSPRACDLYYLQGLIADSFQKALLCISADNWDITLNCLNEICQYTTTTLQGSQNGPLVIEKFLEILISPRYSIEKKEKAFEFSWALINSPQNNSKFYEDHATEQLLLARLAVEAGDQELTKRAWQTACHYLFSYGYHKDITVYELLDPIEVFISADKKESLNCLEALQSLMWLVLRHTDQKETHHAIHQWLDYLARIQPAATLRFLTEYGLGDLPLDDSFDHAIPLTLESLSKVMSPELIATAWLAFGSNARDNVQSALKSCEKLKRDDTDLVINLWLGIVASLIGDGFSPQEGLSELLPSSKNRIGVSFQFDVPVAEKSAETDKNESPHRIQTKFSMLPQGSTDEYVKAEIRTPLQIINWIKSWRSLRPSNSELSRFTNRLGWRLLEIINTEGEALAEKILHNIGTELKRWDLESFFTNLGEGFNRQGEKRLAAIAFVYAYTKNSDGWRNFGGQKHIDSFQKALTIEADTAWELIASELVSSISNGGDYGTNAHLCELLITGGKIEDAFKAWQSAHKIISLRLPETSEKDNSYVCIYKDADDPGFWLLCRTVLQINTLLLHEKRIAYTGIALAILTAQDRVNSVLQYCLKNPMPISTIIILLLLIEKYEKEPFPITRSITEELKSLLVSPYFGVRYLSKKILTKVSCYEDAENIPMNGIEFQISDSDIQGIKRVVRGKTIEALDKRFPGFEKCFAAIAHQGLASEMLKEKMQRHFRDISYREGQIYNPMWDPADEEILLALQKACLLQLLDISGSSGEKEGLEREIAELSLFDIDISVRRMLSRVPRPAFSPVEPKLLNTCEEREIIRISEGDDQDWILAAHFETKVEYKDDHENTVTGKRNTVSGLTILATGDNIDSIPLGYGNPDVWINSKISADFRIPFFGPLIGFCEIHDLFGEYPLLVPHPILRLVEKLLPGPTQTGHTLINEISEPRIVFRYWREKYVPSTYIHHQEPIYEGMMVLIKPEILTRLKNYSIGALRYFVTSQ